MLGTGLGCFYVSPSTGPHIDRIPGRIACKAQIRMNCVIEIETVRRLRIRAVRTNDQTEFDRYEMLLEISIIQSVENWSENSKSLLLQIANKCTKGLYCIIQIKM